MNFNDFVNRLSPLAEVIKTTPGRKTALEANPTAAEGYVSPSFKVTSWPNDAAVILVEAPGAVGKSSAALALAERARWPLVRAERAQVGSYTLSGLVLGSITSAGTFIESLRDGSAGIVVDSLDEAHFRAGTHNFLEFLRTLKCSPILWLRRSLGLQLSC